MVLFRMRICWITRGHVRRAGRTLMTALASLLRLSRTFHVVIKSTIHTGRNATLVSFSTMALLISIMTQTSIHSLSKWMTMTNSRSKRWKSSIQRSFKETSASKPTSKNLLWASSSPLCESWSSMRTLHFCTRSRANGNQGDGPIQTIPMMSILMFSWQTISLLSVNRMKGRCGSALNRWARLAWLSTRRLWRKILSCWRTLIFRLTKETASCSAQERKKFWSSWLKWLTMY